MIERKHPLASCEVCPYFKQHYVPSDVNVNASFTVLGESPGRDEVRTGKPFTGPSGDLLWHSGLKRSECTIINVISCVPPEQEQKIFHGSRGEYDQMQQGVMKDALTIELDKAQAAKCCSKRLNAELADAPGRMLLLGRIAQEAVVPGLTGSINTQLGRWIIQKNQQIIYTHHPAYVLRAPGEARTFFRCVQKFFKDPSPGVKLTSVPDYEIVETPEYLNRLVDHWRSVNGLEICIDLETDQIDWQHDNILCMGIYDGFFAYVVPKSVWDCVKNFTSGWFEWRQALWDFFDLTCEWVLQNGKFDMRFLNGQYGFPNAHVTWDTMLAHYALDERKGTHDLKGLCAFAFDVEDWELGMAQWIGTSRAHNARYSIIPQEVLFHYVTQDVYYDLHLKWYLERQLVKENLVDWPFKNLLMPASDMLLAAEIYGIKVDRGLLEELYEDYQLRLQDADNEVCEFTDYEIENAGSPMQVGHFVWDVLGLKLQKRLKKKPRSTDDEVIAQLLAEVDPKSEAFEFLTLIRKFRRIAKLLKSYIKPLLFEYLDEHDRVHPEFMIQGTETGRISARNPAIQTIPRPNDRDIGVEGQKLRSLFIADSGCMLVSPDYSQAELRLAAHLANDSFLLEAYREGRDIHSEVTTRVFGPHFTDEQRQRIKVLNFRFLNGGNMKEGLYARGESIPQEVANQLAADYASTMKDLIVYSKDMKKLLHKQGYIQSMFGRKRRMPLINLANKEEARKIAINQPIQGAASDLTMLAAIELCKRPEWTQWGAHILLLLHDSILINVAEEYSDACAMLAAQVMKEVGEKYAFRVPWKTDAKIGRTWK